MNSKQTLLIAFFERNPIKQATVWFQSQIQGISWVE